MNDATRPLGESGNGKSSFTYECRHCGKPTTRRKQMSGRRVYCSAECRALGPARYPSRECKQCGKTFNPERPDGRAGRDSRIFCSHDCYMASKRNQVTQTCPVCGKDFTLPASTAARQHTCSMACKTADTKYVDCERCGKRIYAGWRGDRRHCSEECRRPPQMMPCRNCGSEFRTVLSDMDRQFCSRTCMRRFTGETRLEARVRVALECLGVAFTQEYEVGRWSIDFAIVRHKIGIEADGEYWHRAHADRDAKRDARLHAAGWRMIRLLESEVNASRNVGQLVLERIYEVTGLKHDDLTLAPSERPAVPAGRPRRRRSAWKRLASEKSAGQLALWP